MFQKRESRDFSQVKREEDPNDPRLLSRVSFLSDWRELWNEKLDPTNDLILWSYSDDRGVERNLGRLGTGKAPKQLLRRLYSLALHRELRIFDLGDFRSWDYDLSEAHFQAKECVKKIRELGLRCISIGGGHDWAYPDFSESFPYLVNLDAHLDVRPDAEEQSRRGHSGTPFRKIAEDDSITKQIYQIGLERSQNSKNHIAYAESQRMRLLFLDELKDSEAEQVEHVQRMFDDVHEDSIGISLDLDCLRQSECPGVSAPSPVGLSANVVLSLISKLKSRSPHLGVYELNPNFDLDERSTRLAARLIYEFIS